MLNIKVAEWCTQPDLVILYFGRERIVKLSHSWYCVNPSAFEVEGDLDYVLDVLGCG